MFYAFIHFGQIIGYGQSKEEALNYVKLEGKACVNSTIDQFEKKGSYSMMKPLILEMSKELYDIIHKDIRFQDFVVCTSKEGVSQLQTVGETPFYMKD